MDGYVCMLAVLKVHAVYVPMDPGFPADRISYIAADAGVRTVLSHWRLAGLVTTPGPEVVYVDQAAMIAAENGERLTVVDTGASPRRSPTWPAPSPGPARAGAV